MNLQDTYNNSCTIVTSIHEKNEVLETLANSNRDLIIVGDTKSPEKYDLDCEYLDIEKQNKYFSKFSKLLPTCHYSRKNLGYLYAISRGYNFIFETDDDNMPQFNDDIQFDFYHSIFADHEMLNIYLMFIDTEWNHWGIWPRGFPHSKIFVNNPAHLSSFELPSPKASIVYGLCDGDTDVDAIYRIGHKTDIRFEGSPLLVNNKNLIVFNSQSTFWIDPEMFMCLYLPTTVTSRFSDILRSYVTQYVLRSKDKNIGVCAGLVYQDRNEHNLYHDLEEELFMYKSVDKLPEILSSVKVSENISDYIYDLYLALMWAKIVDTKELIVLENWINLVS